MQVIAEAAIFRACESKRAPKKSGIVLLERCCVMILVLLPSTVHASSEPMNALPRPIHVDERPKVQPNWPAYPTKITAEKYDVPNENIVCVPNLIPKHWIGDKYDVDKKLNQFARNKAKPRIGIVSSLSHYNIDNIREDQNGKAVFETKTSDGTIKYINEDNVEVNFADTKPIIPPPITKTSYKK